MQIDYQAIDRYIEDHLDETLGELARLCAQPSISAQNIGITECAALVASLLEARGFSTQTVVIDGGNPIVYAEAAGTSDKTMLFYNHYDVQPPEPLEDWTTPAFEPTIREGKMFARGVSDDKGHLVMRFAALDAIKAVTGSYPCRLKFVIEGEEETSSASLPKFVHQYADMLKGDACIWEFGVVDHEDRSVQVLGLRGICYVELHVKVGELDAHSGYGSVIPNAAWRLTWALNTLKNQDERVLIAGFYDNVLPPSAVDLALLADMPSDAESIRAVHGLTRPFVKGEGADNIEFQTEMLLGPSCTICGINSGYQGPKSKTIVPARASAKIDFRLVPQQTPAEILQKLRAHLDLHGFSDIEIEFHGGEAPARTDPSHPLVKIAVDTAREVYGKAPVVTPTSGGSGPNHIFVEELHVPIITAGAGYPGGRIHAPDENIRISDFVKGIRHTARILCEFAKE
jgi:acetylornithine deacetylase/succinyl-diaminopimelate desuccinylase-like protein